MLNITMEQANVKKSNIFSLSGCLSSMIFHIVNNDKQDARIVKNLTPKVPEKKRLLKKVINPTIGGWSK